MKKYEKVIITIDSFFTHKKKPISVKKGSEVRFIKQYPSSHCLVDYKGFKFTCIRTNLVEVDIYNSSLYKTLEE